MQHTAENLQLSCNTLQDILIDLNQVLNANKSKFRLFSRDQTIDYSSRFSSVLDYRDIIYRYAAYSIFKPLYSVYHSAQRYCLQHSSLSFITHFGSSSLVEWCSFHWYLSIYKAIIGHLPPYVTTLLNYSYHTRFSSSGSVNTELGKSTFSVFPPITWNILQSSLKLSSLASISQFRSLITYNSVTVYSCLKWFFF